jgi:hypothetical protein
MADHMTRLLNQDELRAANTLFRGSLHVAPATDEEWTRSEATYQPERTRECSTTDSSAPPVRSTRN